MTIVNNTASGLGSCSKKSEAYAKKSQTLVGGGKVTMTLFPLPIICFAVVFTFVRDYGEMTNDTFYEHGAYVFHRCRLPNG